MAFLELLAGARNVRFVRVDWRPLAFLELLAGARNVRFVWVDWCLRVSSEVKVLIQMPTYFVVGGLAA